ncbi:DUF3533 domain-containing protein [Planosporangium thailandense]|uniref:DUF3533 domain-containing protein n=1 Tax=Planosporangium thailandense TaxID=765197 RepID=A0ABX0Y729_9ACTN|nr:DUF3533 domain-containing protein [Planosporangium thailandense]NJC73886.1 DUF3533 domain-containing protein [Planosporangium thailandense]
MNDRTARREYRAGLVVILIGIIMASLFVASYSLALGRPAPRRIPTGVVGDPAQHPVLVAALEQATRRALVLHPYPSARAARAAIDRQELFAALVLSPDRALLLVSSASGASVALVLERAAEQVGEQLAPGRAQPVRVVDVHPLPPTDPQGLVSFYVTIAATVLGFVVMFQLRANAAGLSLRDWLSFIGILAVLGGLAFTVVVDPILHALRGAFGELWGVLAVQIAVAALFNSTMLVLFHRWAIIPTWLLFIAFGNPSSGGAVAAPLLPQLYALVGRLTPSGAAVRLIHQTVYFAHTQRRGPFLVEGLWLVGCLAALLISVRVTGRKPTESPG